MKKWRYCILILIVIACLAMPVSADLLNGYYRVAPNVQQGATVFIGEQGLNITPALAEANANGMVTAYTTIGWWQNPANLQNSPPTVSVDTAGRTGYFTVTQFEFDTYEGQWYLVAPDMNNHAKSGVGAVFTVKSPRLDVTIRNPDLYDGADVSGQSVPIGTRLQFQIGTNMYTVLDPVWRTPVYGIPGSGPNTDGYLDIVIRNGSGSYLELLKSDTGAQYSVKALNVSTQPYTWGRANRGLGPGIDYVWNTSTYPAGTYTVSAMSKLNNIQTNYLSGSAMYTGRTVSVTKTITFPGDTPSTSSATKIGIYNGGNWYMDFNGDGMFSGIDRYIPYGASGWSHIIGDWNGDGKSEIGIYKDGLWYIDYGGSGVIDANTKYYSFGGAGWTPIVGDWNADTRDEIGVYQNGNWYLDYNGNGFWDTGDKNYGFGAIGWTPVVGKW